MLNPPKPKPTKTQPKLKPGSIVDGFTVVEPPKSAKERQAMETDDFTGSGGARSAHRQAANR